MVYIVIEILDLCPLRLRMTSTDHTMDLRKNPSEISQMHRSFQGQSVSPSSEKL